MDILFLAPHPLYQDRGTPIAVDMILKVLSERGDDVDVIAFHEGREIEYEHVTLHRIPAVPFIKGVRPGFSWKKVICDLVMFFVVVRFVYRKRYQLIHSVEESVFIALAVKWLFGIPYVYDMDSCLSEQMVEKYPFLRLIEGILRGVEKAAVRNAKVVLIVSEGVRESIEKYSPGKVVVVEDVSLLKNMRGPDPVSIKTKCGILGLVVLYVGNLEPYQGIDLLLESFALVLERTEKADLVIIGGELSDVRRYKEKAAILGIRGKVHLLGPKPVEHLAGYLSEADILVSPRITGRNTPMKLYSYLDSGKPVVATDLPTHTQVLDNRVAMLAQPSPEAFAMGICRVIEDATLRLELGMAGRRLVEERFSYPMFCQKVNCLLDWLETEVDTEHGALIRRAGHSTKSLP